MNGIPTNLSELAQLRLNDLKEEGLSSPESEDDALEVVHMHKKPRLRMKLDELRAARRLSEEVQVRDQRIDDLDLAIISALTVLEAEPWEVVPVKHPSGHAELVSKSRWEGIRIGVGPTALEFMRTWAHEMSAPLAGFARTLVYATLLIKHYHSGFDEYTEHEQADLLAQTVRQLGKTWESLEELRKHLEYAAPGRKAVPAAKNPSRDIRAALLKDIHALTNSQIAEELGVPTPPDLDIKGDHPVVRQMTNRGRSLLKQAYGEEGWRARVEAMRIEAERWKSLDKKEKFYTLVAEEDGISVEEVRQNLSAWYSQLLSRQVPSTETLYAWPETLDGWLDRWLVRWDEKTYPL